MARIDVSELRERCRALPQKLVLELFGFRQWVELQRFADKWRLPIGGKTTDMFAVFRELRSFAAKYGTVLSALIDDLPSDGSEGELGVRYLRAKIAKTEADATAAELRVAQKLGQLLDRADVHSLLMTLADRLRKASDAAQRRWGQEGFDFFNDLWTDFDAKLAELDTDDVPSAGDDGGSP